eukprot:2334294-Pleurochrysis_carterae.AAC.1
MGARSAGPTHSALRLTRAHAAASGGPGTDGDASQAPTAPARRRAWWRPGDARDDGAAAPTTTKEAPERSKAAEGVTLLATSSGARTREQTTQGRTLAQVARGTGSERAAAAARAAERAAQLALTGALGARRDDEWLDGEPTAEQAERVAALRE